MATSFREQLKVITSRDIQPLQAALAARRKKDRKMTAFNKQTDALLQVVSQSTLTKTRTPIVWSPSGVDAQTQTDEQPRVSYSEEAVTEMEREGALRAALSPVYQTLECVIIEMDNKGITNVLLSNWLVSLLAIIRQINPTSQSFSNYYYKNEARAQGTPLHMLKVEAGVNFMSALDNMCTYSPAGTEKGLFSDSELLVHYAVANASRMNNSEISYVQFCRDPLSYTVQQLAQAINIAIVDIVEFVKKPLSKDEKTNVSVKWFPPSYVQVVRAVNALLQAKGSNLANNSVLVQFLPLTKSTSQMRAGLTNKEIVFLGLIMRTALMWYMTYSLSSTVQGDSILAYQALLNRCMVTDGIVVQSLYNAGKGPYQSTGMLVPGLFAYLFYVSTEPTMTQTLGSLSLSSPLASFRTTSLTNRLQAWRAADFEVRDKLARFIHGDSVLQSKMMATTAAFPGTTRSHLQGQVDSAVVSFLREILVHKHAYATPTSAVIDYLKEVSGSTEYLQVSQRTRTDDYKLTMVNNMARTAMTGLLKNPFLYKVHNTMKFDPFGRETVHTTLDTVVLTPVAPQ